MPPLSLQELFDFLARHAVPTGPSAALVEELKRNATRFDADGLTAAQIAQRVVETHRDQREIARHRITLLKVLERHLAHSRSDVW